MRRRTTTHLPILLAALVAAQAAPAAADAPACEPIPPVEAAGPVGTGPCPGVRPGGLVLVPAEGGGSFYCTLNFVFRGSDGRRYAGTAGHCLLSSGPLGGDVPTRGEIATPTVAQRVWSAGSGPVARDGSGARIGEFAYAVLDRPADQDFALIRLDAGVQANPQMCHFGGPTGGIDASRPDVTRAVPIHYFGNGAGVGNLLVANQTTLAARSALAVGMPSPTHVYAQGLVVPGDSGAPAITAEGRALGVVVTTGPHSSQIGTSGIDAGTIGIVRLGPQLERAQQATGLGYALEQAPLL